MRKVLLYLFLFFSFFLPTALAVEVLNDDYFTNHFHVSTGPEDWGTIYLLEDHTYSWMPYYKDQDRRHICSGNWFFSKPNQSLKLGRAPGCLLFEGTYQASRQGEHLRLSNDHKTFIFKSYD